LAETKQLPLAGKRVVVTRAPEQAGELIHQLEQLGSEVLLLPSVAFTDLLDCAPLDAAIDQLPRFDWLLFTSQNAVRFLAKRCRGLGRKAAAERPLVAAVGPATAGAAEEEGFRVEYVAGRFRGKALAEELSSRLAGKRVLLPRSDLAGPDLPAMLRGGGADVVEVIAYRTIPPDSFDPGVSDAICRGAVDVITFMSPSAFHHVVEMVGVETLRRVNGRVTLAAIGPVTTSAIREVGLTVEIEAREATANSLAAAISDYFAQHLSSGVKPS
jgi:uroporphyrinogen III methyltransferase / synthase